MSRTKDGLLCSAVIIITLILSGLNILSSTISGVGIENSIMSIVFGAIIIALLSAVKGKLFYIFSGSLYAFVILTLIMHLSARGNYHEPATARFFYITSDLIIFSAALTPLAALMPIKLVDKHKPVKPGRFLWIYFLMLVPLVLLFAIRNHPALIMSLIVLYLIIFLLIKDKLIEIPWPAYFLNITAVICGGYYIYNTGRIRDQAMLILSRGQIDPEGRGWVRVVLDTVFRKALIFGRADFSELGMDINRAMREYGGYNIVTFLVNYGWVAFAAILLGYVLLFAIMLRMCVKVNGSSFVRYSMLALTLSLIVQFVYSTLGIFVLSSNMIEMPFMSTYSVNTEQFIAAGLISALYMKRGSISAYQQEIAEQAESAEAENDAKNSKESEQ